MFIFLYGGRGYYVILCYIQLRPRQKATQTEWPYVATFLHVCHTFRTRLKSLHFDMLRTVAFVQVRVVARKIGTADSQTMSPHRPSHIGTDRTELRMCEWSILYKHTDILWKFVLQPEKAESIRGRPSANVLWTVWVHRTLADSRISVHKYRSGLQIYRTVALRKKISAVVPDDTGRVQPHSNPVRVNQTCFHGEIKIDYTIHIFINATQSTVLVQSRMWLWITIW
jgi:hypothetical protein